MPSASSDSPAFVAGLDGLRALAVIAVLAFHLQFDAASGGFLGVSLFFTLSGYLITALLLHEHARHGRIDVRAFWVRRLRRLMPASAVVIACIALAAVLFDRFPSERLRGDLFAALGYVANWRFMSGSNSYAELFTSTPSPVLHFWSLAIEEQFYAVFPLVMVGLLSLGKKGAVPVGLGLLTAVSVTIGLATGSQDVVYYGAHTRAAEILVGSLLALWLPLGGFRPDTPGSRLVRSPIANSLVFGSAAVAFVALTVVVETDDSWLYSGGLPAFSMLSMLLVIGVQSPGIVRWCARRPTAVRIGGLSYGLYLFHWPVFLLVTEDSIRWSGWPLHAVRLAITAVLAWGSARLLEQPIRGRRILGSARSSALAFVVTIAVCATAIAVVPRTPSSVLAGLDAPDGFVNFAEDALPQLDVAVIGSETSAVSRLRSALEGEFTLTIADETDSKCPVGSAAGCDDPTTRFTSAVARHRPDVVVAAFGNLDRSTVLQTVGEVAADDPAFFDTTKEYVNAIAAALPTTPVLFLDLGEPDAMAAFMEDVALRLTNVSVLASPTPGQILSVVQTVRSMAAGQDERQRIMVVGDSTSYGISVAIDHLEGERIDVLWAGGQNCPLVDVQAVKWWEGVEFDLQRCPSLEVEWRQALDSFRPSLVLVAVSVPEQADQQYPGDPSWHAPGSAEYTRVHDDFIARFMGEASSRGIDVLILDSPAIHGGALAGAPFSTPDRIAIWNSVVARWAEVWPEVTVIPWASEMAAFEPTPGALREDGVHLRQEDLDDLVSRAILPIVLQRLFGAVGDSAVEAQAETIE